MMRLVKKIYWLMNAQFGIDPRKTFRAILGLPRYFRDFFRFNRTYKGCIEMLPCLHDWREGAGAIKDEYFWQDLYVSHQVYLANPQKHVDIGSSVDGFVAHVASFREIEVFDIRPIMAQIPNAIFKQIDLMNPLEGMNGYCDSLSCLHALEHFGLGRYGDEIDPRGFERGLMNMGRLLSMGGVFYLSVPIGIDRVEFNAHRIFDPRVIVDLCKMNSLKLTALFVIRRGSNVLQIMPNESELAGLARERYALGIFIFVKCADSKKDDRNTL